jgi:hypothetical protein
MKHLLAIFCFLWPIAAWAGDTYPAGFDPTGSGCGMVAGKIQCLGTSQLTARAVDLHTLTGDVAQIAIPSYVTAYQITAVKITNCSATPVLAQVAVYTGSGATGTNVVAAATITGATSASVVLSSTLASTARLTASTIFVRLTVANVAALTCDVHLNIDDLT